MRAERTTILSGSWTRPPEFELCPESKVALRFKKVKVFDVLEWMAAMSSHIPFTMPPQRISLFICFKEDSKYEKEIFR